MVASVSPYELTTRVPGPHSATSLRCSPARQASEPTITRRMNSKPRPSRSQCASSPRATDGTNSPQSTPSARMVR